MAINFLNYNEASDYQGSIPDFVTRELTGLLFSVLVKEALKGNLPEGEFDALFFVKIVAQGLSSREKIARVLNGESLLWPDVSE